MGKKIDKEVLQALVPAIINAVIVTYEAMEPEEEEEIRMEGYVHEEAVKTYKQFEDFPRVLSAKHLVAMFGITPAKAYQLLNHHGCPKNPILGKNKTDKIEFLKWIEENNMTHGELLAYEKAEAKADGEK